MNSTHLTDKQIAHLAAIVARDLRFLGKLRTRMEQMGFRPDDRLYFATDRAFSAIHAMNVELHYMGCKGGVGR